ncbi:D-alanyl-D-alanine carboxypeptidase/D-alanyl-D-alanine endopeptidase [Streptomyces odontomachi]|uniref:D-alanyl-D-alanine carboxypeptidase/D-alanyl-D-alanine endopeptidase n=1 Tax=Streptomyces odontomachi TaxID=2944940 RepID=UPI00210C726B|nr:D-alanyl-D-alanine carboxypeptidase/D-alanyl-D-alanine-endopeptidase [Streptomyces sp. ODS25]
MSRSVRERVPGRGRNRLRGLIAALALAALAWSAPAGSAGADGDDSGLPQALDGILADARMSGGQESVTVADADSGDVLYQHTSGNRLMPASNTKLLTSTAAMAVLGPDYRFSTDVLSTGRQHGTVLNGDLYLRGTGDPTLLAEDYDQLAAQLAGAGVKQVTGRLVADDTRFDDQRLGRSWAADDEASYYSAQISALAVAPNTDYDTGTVITTITPGAAVGDKAKVTVTPPTHYVHVDVTATTAPAGDDGGITVDRAHGTNDITISGSIPADADPDMEWVTVWDPTGYAAAVFRDALAAHGVHVLGPTSLGRATPDGARTLATHDSMQLKDLLIPFLKLSNNMHAEILTKAMGVKTAGEGSWDAGLAAVDDYLKGLGLDTAQLRQVDGSGLSRMDNVPAETFAELLVKVRHEPWFDDWYKGLPVACDPDRFVGGTLRSRMCDTPAALNARGKTGTLTGASSLSGYVTDAGGRKLVYSILLNNFLADSVTDIQDAIVVTLASSSADKAVTVSPRSLHEDKAAEQDGAGLECAWLKPQMC